MHTFDDYRAPDDAHIVGLVRTHPFAVVVSVDEGVPIASHLPVILPDPAPDALEGCTLSSHMARVNRQWRSFDPSRPVLLVFTAADAYVSAGLYERTPAVPTWNYSAVHVIARPEIVDDDTSTLQILTATVQALERTRPQPWDMTASVGHFASIAAGVAAFRLHVVEVQAVFKLSQDKPDVLFDRVEHGLATGTDPGARQVALDMREVRALPDPAG